MQFNHVEGLPLLLATGRAAASEEPGDLVQHLQRCTLLGVQCHAITIPELLHLFERAISEDRRNVVIGNHNLHSLYVVRRDAAMRRFYARNTLTYIDGMPLILMGKLLGLRLSRRHRTAFLDWHEQLFSLAEKNGWRIFYLGGRRESLLTASEVIRERYPNLTIHWHHGFFSSASVEETYDRIRACRPHILLVGMGMPRQERWILNALDNITANVVVAGGAMMEYLVGEQKAAPRWVGQIGMEWLFRLVTQPRRLGHRYVVEPVLLLGMLLRDALARWQTGR